MIQGLYRLVREDSFSCTLAGGSEGGVDPDRITVVATTRDESI